MLRFIVQRILTALLVFAGVSFLTFALMSVAPGDAALEVAIARYGGAGQVDAATVEWIRKKEGLDQPLYHQYAVWVTRLLRLDLGRSLVEEVPVRELIAARFRNTLTLALAAVVLALLISLPLGILAGIKRGRLADTLSVSVAVLGVSIPNFYLGLLLILLFAVRWHWLPAYGHGSWQHLILPALTLGTALTAYTTRILRSAVVETLKSEYLLALRARGVHGLRLYTKHVLKNTLIPVITVVGMELGMVLEGAVITETIFAWPGLGDLLVTAVSNRDYPLIQGLVLLVAALFVGINLLVDVCYRYLDPRIRES